MPLSQDKSLPEKLKNDAIIEAILEIRFEVDAAMAPEIIIGLLVSCDDWKGFSQNRLPLADIPPPVRQMEPNFRHQPIIELVSADQSAAIKFGERVVSYHAFRPYCGWNQLSQRLTRLVDHLFRVLPNATIGRLGLRYLNAFVPALHHINSISELEIGVRVGGEPISGQFNLNYLTEIDDQTSCLVRIASPSFVQGDVPRDASALVDVDVFTPAGFSCSDRAQILNWLNASHVTEKDAFFSLLSQEQIEGMNN